MERQDRTQHEDDGLWERIFSRSNLFKALEKVRKNKGGSGIDGMTVDELPDHLRKHWLGIRAKLDKGIYTPSPVKQVEIPKTTGGQRLLGIPTVLDRMIQQAIHQVLSPIFETTFSDRSYGFRPNRSAHDAVKEAQRLMNEGYEHVVDIDLEKFFDTVHHERLLARLREVIQDQRVINLIASYLRAGVMINGIMDKTEKGTPQGGPLSPLLSNIVLTELDNELEKRGHQFVRYADDCRVYVKSEKSAQRVMKSLTRFIEKRMKLKVNQSKSATDEAINRPLLGFAFRRTRTGKIIITVSPKSLKKVKIHLKQLTRRNQGNSPEYIRDRVNNYLIGWVNYYRLSAYKSVMNELDKWLRRRMRQILWKQWKTTHNRVDNLLQLGITKDWAIRTALSSKSYWRISKSKTLNIALNNAYWQTFGLKNFLKQYNLR